MRDRRGLGVGVPDGDGDLEGIRIGSGGQVLEVQLVGLWLQEQVRSMAV